MRTLVRLVVSVLVLCLCLTDAFPRTASDRPTGRTCYSSSFVPAGATIYSLDLPTELRARKRGKRGSVGVHEH